MLETVIEAGGAIWGMGIALGIGGLAKAISSITIGKMVKAAGEIQKSDHRLMRLVKAKFEHGCMVNGQVKNVESFVKKYLYEYRVFGIRLGVLRGIPGTMVWVVAFLGIFQVLGGYEIFGMGERVFRQGCCMAVCITILLGFCLRRGEEKNLEMAKNYMVDYLENVCLMRYKKSREKTRALMEADTRKEDIREKETRWQERKGESGIAAEAFQEEKEDGEKGGLRREQQMRIRAILEEFLA